MAVETIGAVTAASEGTDVTPGATANTKGSWVELVASSTLAAEKVIFVVGNPGDSSNVDYLLDIGTGGAGAEAALIANFLFRGQIANVPHNTQYEFLIPIAAGTRISARCQANVASGIALNVTGYLLGTGTDTHGMTNITTYGATTADSGGTGVDPGTSIHTKGSYAEITPSSARNIDYLSVIIGNRGSLSMANATWLIDIATGGAGSESVVIANIFVQSGTSPDFILPQILGPFPVSIPSGTRIAARAQSTATLTNRLIDIILVGSDGPAPGGGGAHFHASM